MPSNKPPVYNINKIDVIIKTMIGIRRSTAFPFSFGFSLARTSPSSSLDKEISFPLLALLSIYFIFPKSKPVIEKRINITIVKTA